MSHTLLMATNFNLCQQIVLYANLGFSQITFSLCPLVNRNISYKKALKTNEMLTCIILYNLPFIWPVTKKNENEKLIKQNKKSSAKRSLKIGLPVMKFDTTLSINMAKFSWPL